MIQKFKVMELAYTTRFVGDYKPFTKENLYDCLVDMLELHEGNEEFQDRSPEMLRKGIYQDNYFIKKHGKQYVIQHDILCDYLVLYEVISEEME